MGSAEQSEYVELIRAADWTPQRMKRLHELRKWRTTPTEQIPAKYRTKPPKEPVQ